MKKEKGKRIPPFAAPAVIAVSLGAFSGIIHLICILSPAFADLWGATAGHLLRFILAKISGIAPFSFGELIFLSSPLIIFTVAYLTILSARRGRAYLIRSLCIVLATASFVYSTFAMGFGPGYRQSPLSKKLGITEREITPEELYETTLTVVSEINDIAPRQSYRDDGSTALSMTVWELSRALSIGYEKTNATYSYPPTFKSSVKPLVSSPYMTYTHISGIYTFFTGEANLNTNYPDYVNVYTAAHEMAHQRGVSREDEANFCAFLVCISSDNEYIRYCGYMNMYDYLSAALFEADPTLYADAERKLCREARGERYAYSLFFDKYRDSTASDVSDTLNNAYLEGQGTEGTKSYGMVVDLAVSYYMMTPETPSE